MWTKILIGLLIAVALFIIGARLFSPEDTWICQDGQWVKHGNPSAPMPSGTCR
jgi:hypothetical protein